MFIAFIFLNGLENFFLKRASCPYETEKIYFISQKIPTYDYLKKRYFKKLYVKLIKL